MKKYFIYTIMVFSLGLTSCKDYLTEIEPATTLVSDFYQSTAAAKQNVTGCYTPLMWEFNSTYFSEWFIGDVVSDDALKGGQNTNDMGAVYDMENWKTTSTNVLLRDYYRAQYLGIGRCNVALTNISKMPVGIEETFTASTKNNLLGEVYFLRAYYYFRLLRLFGGTPLVTEVLDSQEKWTKGRASVAEMFDQIISDLEKANEYLLTVDKISKEDLGRATKGAAQAMLLKTYLYMASPYWNAQVGKDATDCYKKAQAWGDSVITSKMYDLCDKYHDNFTLEGENGPESVFEIQYAEVAWGDYGQGYGYTAGSFTQILVRSRNESIGGGWGFNHPTQNLYNEFEAEDSTRLHQAIYTPASIQNENEEVYLGSAYLNNKYAMYDEYPGGWPLHASRGPLNNKQIRYADVLLMMAEACLGAGDPIGQGYLDLVRARVGLAPSSEFTWASIRHERRCELAMEGHRWFDLVRWGIAGSTMTAYKNLETKEAQAQMATFIEGKHEIFPIPAEEIELNPMEQNKGY